MEMITGAFADALRIIVFRLEGSRLNWAITGSLGFALQGLPVDVNDIDVQTDESGAYEIERLLNEFVQRRVTFSASERIRSHFGALQINGVSVEIMGDVEKRLTDNSWESPPDIAAHKRLVEFQGLLIPVLSLEYECRAYRTLGRIEKAKMLEEWLTARGIRIQEMGEK